MGGAKAPNTWEAYRSGSFWGHIFDKWGDDIPKPLPLLYSGLNGASLKGGRGPSVPALGRPMAVLTI